MTCPVFLYCRVNTLVRSVLLWKNKGNNNNYNAEITPFTPGLAGRNLHMSKAPSLQRRDAGPINCFSKEAHASGFLYTSGSPHARHIRAHFELWGRPFRSSLLASFFFFPFGVAMKEVQSTQLFCHILFLSFVRLTTCFYYPAVDGYWIYVNVSCSVCIYSTHTCYLFKRRTPVGSSEAAVCVFCLFNFTTV